MNVIAYIRVSTDEQADSGAGLLAQRDQIEHACLQRGWTIEDILEDAAVSGGTPWDERPALSEAIRILAAGGADALMVAKLDRLTRSLLDFVTLMECARTSGWSFVALDLGVDTTTPAGELAANMMAAFAQFERRLIGQRTREALAQKRLAGIHIGRKSLIPGSVRERIRRERVAGQSYRAIADDLNTDAVPTGQGAALWHASSVRAALKALDQPET